LSRLKHFPVDFLKIDRSFVAGLASTGQDAILVRSMIELAHGLGMRVVAEGVETREQAERLTEMGCEVGQGYYFGRPGEAFHVSEYLDTRLRMSD
jgi:EAL domain-containing protein (putative c-di-GMP-specific phosphodiesterase class I)